MRRPFLPGQTVAWLEPEPFGIRVHRATVLGIEPSKERDHWHITTDRGHATVNHTGESARILSIDNEIATDLYTRGDGFFVQPTLTDHIQIVREHKQELDTDLDADLGDDLGLD
jgi:hypothetical protein